jgi:hypothetical protein
VVLDENRVDLAEQRSRQALALFEELARPAPSLGKELATAKELHDYLLANGGQKKR